MKIKLDDDYYYPQTPMQAVPFLGCRGVEWLCYLKNEKNVVVPVWDEGILDTDYIDDDTIRIAKSEFWKRVDEGPVVKCEISWSLVVPIPFVLLTIVGAREDNPKEADIDECLRVLGERGKP